MKKYQINDKNLSKLTHINQVRFALFCAYQAEDKWKHLPGSVEAAETVKMWLNGEINIEECELAMPAANETLYGVIYTMISDTLNSPLSAVYCSESVLDECYSTDEKKKNLTDQRAYYEELLDINKVFEDNILT